MTGINQPVMDVHSMKIRKIFIVLLHALISWAGCAAIMGIGMATLPIKTTLFHV